MLFGTRRLAPIVMSLAVIASGCVDNPTGPDSAREATPAASGLTLLLTDAPGDFLSAVVTISSIYFQSDGGRITLVDEPFTTDLLSLRDTYATLVQGLDVPPGTYTQLRAVVTGGYIEVDDGTGSKIFASSPDYPGLPSDAHVDGALQMPSWGASGLKIEMPDGRLEVGEGQTIVLIDFNVLDSFGHEAGRSGRWVMKPRITATNVVFGGDVLARLQLGAGVTLPELDGQALTLGAFTALLTPSGGSGALQMAMTDADADGVFEALFKGLPPGDYELDFGAPAGLLTTFDPPLPRLIHVLQNETATELVTVSSAVLAGSIVANLSLAQGVTLPTIDDTPVTLAQFKAVLTPTGGGAPVELVFTDANEDGTFEAAFGDLLPGDYSLTVVPPTGVTATFDPVPPVDITLAEGATETRAFVVTAAGTI